MVEGHGQLLTCGFESRLGHHFAKSRFCTKRLLATRRAAPRKEDFGGIFAGGVSI